MSVQELSCQEQTYLTAAKTVNAFSIASIMNNNCAEEPDRALTRESVISDDYSRSSSDCSSYEPAPKRIRACSHDIEEEEEDDTEETLSIPRDPELDKIHVNLECKELWAKFSSLGTEMIITKAGRRMFPVVRVRVSGLNPSHHYLVAMDIDPVDDMRYRYAYHRSTWLVAGKADPQPVKRYYLHPDCPFTGDQLQGQVISFEKVKLTNNELDTNNHIILNSMHKYQPRVHIIRRPDKWNGSCDKMTMSQRHARTFAFPETTFIAVTAYQNQLITKLKINSNPFAKGFRDSSRFLTAERPHKMPPPLACRCNTGTPFLCPHARGFMVPDEKEFYASYAAAAGQAQATLAVPDLVYKPGQYAAIPTDEAGNPPYPYLPQTAIPVGLDYSYHKAIPHLSPDGHPYPHQQYPIPSTSVENFTTAAPVFTTFANMWSSTAAPTTYAQRYNVK